MTIGSVDRAPSTQESMLRTQLLLLGCFPHNHRHPMIRLAKEKLPIPDSRGTLGWLEVVLVEASFCKECGSRYRVFSLRSPRNM